MRTFCTGYDISYCLLVSLRVQNRHDQQKRATLLKIGFVPHCSQVTDEAAWVWNRVMLNVHANLIISTHLQTQTVKFDVTPFRARSA